MDLVEGLVRQVSDRSLVLETTAKAGYSAQGSQEWKNAEEAFKPTYLENMVNQFHSLISRMKSLGVPEGKVRKAREEVPKPL